ncbi:hypothetical protein DOTSEDRAFT_84048 [Dothistroma septosporum NZE10]|uniref:Uncharacterized protein n=1 Tax=Dothistroma septosporum (strain NZE10 / CBS 128990) TaxID=675120 RepID=N1PYA0_DOTSN|nr:hypothetical protein DOTSEDRAFT_84048 [Dothistroma septosporum NZE10]
MGKSQRSIPPDDVGIGLRFREDTPADKKRKSSYRQPVSPDGPPAATFHNRSRHITKDIAQRCESRQPSMMPGTGLDEPVDSMVLGDRYGTEHSLLAPRAPRLLLRVQPATLESASLLGPGVEHKGSNIGGFPASGASNGRSDNPLEANNF